MRTNIQVPEVETLLANVSPNQSKTKLREAVLLTRAKVASGGKWRKTLHAVTLVVLACLLLAGSIFAPEGLWASIGAILAAGSFIASIYCLFEFDHGVLKQTVLYFAQAEEKIAAKSSADESRGLAMAQTMQTQATVHQQANELLSAGHSLNEIAQSYAEALSAVREYQQTAQGRNTDACKAVESADREVRDATAMFEDRARRWWPSRLFPAYTRVAASRWLAALEKRAAIRFEQGACSAAAEGYETLAKSLSQLSGDYVDAKSVTSSEASDAGLKIDATNRLQNVTGCNKGLPLPSEIAGIVENEVVLNEASIRQAIASREAEQPLSEAIRNQAEKVASKVRLPESFGEFYSQRNGDKQLLLKQIDLQSHEFATASPTPGRQRIRHRFLMVEGGETAPVCKDVIGISKDMIVRTINHPRSDEFVCVTESRFEPCSEITEYLEGVRQFQSLTPEQRSPMIVAVAEDDFLVAFSPESAHDPLRPVRLLCVGLVLGIIKRTGAECYKAVDANDPHNAHFGKGFSQAIDVLATDQALARNIEQSIEAVYSVDGAEAIRRKLLDAKTKNMVPSSNCKRFREMLDHEIQRASSKRL
ncbi:MAG: hypothetical protein SFY81_08295 [Verrucomicrobiota bacterium]|nr:hypothetical protein [Verrucomicrobiota bacterium]